MFARFTGTSVIIAGLCLSFLGSFASVGVTAQDNPSPRRFRMGNGRVVTAEELSTMLSGPPSRSLVQGTNIRVNQTGPAAETTLVIDPRDPQHIIAAAMDSSQLAVRVTPYVSFDGGQTWEQQSPVRNFARSPDGRSVKFQNQSDPVLTMDSEGNVYVSTIMWNTDRSDNGVFVYRSTNGGRRFSAGVPVVAHIGESNPAFEDKDWITADTTGGPFNDFLYISWTSIGDGSRILFSRSTDRGMTFSTPQIISDDRGVQGSMPRVGPQGEVYVIWLHSRRDRRPEIVVDLSTDGGVTFGADIHVADVHPFGRLRALARHGGNLPSLAVDRSAGPTRGNLYVVWADRRSGDVDILLSRSTDGGMSWSEPIRVNDDAPGNGKDQFMPFVTVDQTTGDLVIGYYDRRDSVENFLVDYRVTWSSDGGETFAPSIKLTDQPFDPSAAFRFIRAANFTCMVPFMGDYASLAAHQGVIVPLWADTRNGRSDIFTQPMAIR